MTGAGAGGKFPRSAVMNEAATKSLFRQHLVDGFCLATKPFFKIGEVARLLGVKPHVLRYWESEFPSLKPRKNPSGQRLYARADIETLTEIRNLLYTDCYTISGARQLLAYQCHSPQLGTGEGVSGLLDESENGLSSAQGNGRFRRPRCWCAGVFGPEGNGCVAEEKHP